MSTITIGEKIKSNKKNIYTLAEEPLDGTSFILNDMVYSVTELREIGALKGKVIDINKIKSSIQFLYKYE